jgi:hypothetical protein
LSRYVYKQLNVVDILVLFVFVFTPVFFLAGDFILNSAAVLFTWAFIAVWACIYLIWAGVTIWWVCRKLRRLFTRT